jgi:hypothetical protein
MIDASHIRRASFSKGDDVESIVSARGAEDETKVGSLSRLEENELRCQGNKS